jgi:MYXO-CTERM domain-containing protein
VAEPVSFAGTSSGCSIGNSGTTTGMAILLALLAMAATPALRRRRQP